MSFLVVIARIWNGIVGAWSSALNRRDFAAIADWFNFWFFGTGMVGLILAAIAAHIDQGRATGWRVLSLGLLLAGACGMTGWLFGLLFGIPRSLARGVQTVPAGPSGAVQTSKVNTNLEDISDWLTKTLTGVALTQLTAAPRFLGDLASAANAYGFGWTLVAASAEKTPHQPGVLLAEAIIVYFTAGGFWLGYVGTRTILTRLLDQIDRVE